MPSNASSSQMSAGRRARRGSAANLYINSTVKHEAAKIAKARYGCSLSKLVEMLLRLEMTAGKKGLLFIKSRAKTVRRKRKKADFNALRRTSSSNGAEIPAQLAPSAFAATPGDIEGCGGGTRGHYLPGNTAWISARADSEADQMTLSRA